jgi:hypothetical protein
MKTFSELKEQIKESAKPKRTLITHRKKEFSLPKPDDFIDKKPIIKKIYPSSMIGRKSPVTIAPIKNVVAQKD